jgi:myo-inositol-1(or 4)-monophosphatase
MRRASHFARRAATLARGYLRSVSQTQELQEACAEAARRGGAVLRERFPARRTISYKGGIDLVTDADHASEEALLEFLRARFPGAAVLAEESGASGGERAGLRFIVDPLDGTTNYAHGLPHFAVNVAAEDERGIVAGATYDPLRDELFLAGRRAGATLNGEPMRVSSNVELRRSLLVTGFPYDVHEDHELPLRLFGALLARARAIRRLGSAALDLAYVACGRFDGFWEMKLKPWDLAPGLLLVREAGGIISDFGGGHSILESGEIVAGNGAIHPRLLGIIQQARGEPRRA